MTMSFQPSFSGGFRLRSLLCVLMAASAVFFSACTKWKTEATSSAETAVVAPEQVVRQFLELSSNAQQDSDKQRLEALCVGELRRAFERMTPETFKMAYLKNEIRLNDLQVLETNAANEQARVRYRVSVHNEQGSDPTSEVNERE